MNLNRLLLCYISALTLLLLSVTASMVITEVEADQLVEDATTINVAGRQRMLSQRIIYLSQDLSISQGNPDETIKAELLSAINELESAIYLFEKSHSDLSAEAAPDSAAHQLYFGLDGNGATLDQRIETYLFLARRILENPQDQSSLGGLLTIERGGLLRDLDKVVTNIEVSSVQRISLLKELERWSLILAIFIVAVEVLFVFIPGHRYLQKTLNTLKRQNIDLERAYDASEALRKEQAEFTYAVSHDLKSPANSIGLILNEVMIDEGEQLSADSREMLDEALDTVKRIGGQVEDILAYAWATADKQEIQSVNLNTCMDIVLSDLKHEIEISSADIDVRINANAIQGYERQVQMLLQNLISNALKFQTKDVDPQILVTADPLPNNEGTRIEVIDNGIGIASQDQGKIFELFQRLHLREEFEGTGLGLATCKRITDNHNGSIEVTSVAQKGARFSVILRDPTLENSNIHMKEAA